MSRYNLKLSEKRKTLEEYFRDWESEAFGFGYGTGEAVLLPLLRKFLQLCNRNGGRGYDYEELEKELGKEVAWLMINALCKDDAIEYGTSPRYGWLTTEGLRLKRFVESKTDVELYACIYDENETSEEVVHCYKDACNCGPNGNQPGFYCANPFWRNRIKPTIEELNG